MTFFKEAQSVNSSFDTYFMFYNIIGCA